MEHAALASLYRRQCSGPDGSSEGSPCDTQAIGSAHPSGVAADEAVDGVLAGRRKADFSVSRYTCVKCVCVSIMCFTACSLYR